MVAKIILDKHEDISMAGIDTLEVEINYNGGFLKFLSNELKVFGVLKNNFFIDSFRVNDIEGDVKFNLCRNSGGDYFNFPEGGELLSFKLKAYLPRDTTNYSDIKCSLTKNFCNECIEILPAEDYLIVTYPYCSWRRIAFFGMQLQL